MTVVSTLLAVQVNAGTHAQLVDPATPLRTDDVQIKEEVRSQHIDTGNRANKVLDKLIEYVPKIYRVTPAKLFWQVLQPTVLGDPDFEMRKFVNEQLATAPAKVKGKIDLILKHEIERRQVLLDIEWNSIDFMMVSWFSGKRNFFRWVH